MKNMTIKESTNQAIIKSVSVAVLLGASLTLTACGNKAAEDSHSEHEHSEHAEEGHEHNHEHSHEHEHNHDEHAEHDHEHHDHAHASGPAQVIPEGYTVNFAVSNHPLFLLSEAVTNGTNTTVKKLLNAGDVGHHGSLSPSDMKTVKDSKYVVWFGKNLESNLSETLENGDNTVTILNEAGINKLKRRDLQMQEISGSKDPHIWSDPQNAKVIVNKLAELHSQANPEYAEQYKANAKAFATNLDELVAKQKAKVGESNKYWSSHDAFQYFEAALGVELVGTLTTDHEIPAKASQIVWLTKNRPYETMCLITQSKPKDGIANKLAPITNKVLIEDMSDSESYLQAWEKESQKIIDCLANK